MVVISSIGFGIFAMILSMGVMNGFNNQMVENTIKTSLGHIAVHKSGFQDDMKMKYNFRLSPKIIRSLESNPAILNHAPRIKIQGMVRSSEASRGVMIVGIDPNKEKEVSSIFDYTMKTEGSRFLNYNEIIGAGFKITGFFQTPIESFDKYVVFVGIKTLQRITGLHHNISEISIVLKDRNSVDRVKIALIKAINDNEIEILTWKDMAPNLVSAVELFDSMMYIFFMIIFLTVIFSVANTLIMAIMERFHEIGVMKSIGTRPLWIFSIILVEAISLGVAGLIIGITSGVIVTEVMSAVGLDFSFYMESMRTWGTGSIIYPTIKTLDIVAATIIVFNTTVIAALYPAIKAARIKPLDALHYV